MKNVKEVTITVEGKDWEKAIDKAFQNKKKDIKIDGFRKGSVTKELYIKKVGIESLFMDASDAAIEVAYKDALKQADIEIVCEPSVSIEEIDKKHCTFKFKLISRPEIKLGKYKNLGVKKEKVTVSKEDVEHEIGHICENMAEIINKENGTVEKGNIAYIDFVGRVDGEVIEGGSGTNYPLEIGSNTFIPGFEDGCVGMKVGEEKVLKLKFPENYVENLKGKDVEFTVTVREIKERIIPELGKDFFDDLGIEGVNDKKSLEDHVKEEITKAKENEADRKYLDEVLRKASENMKVEINDEIIDSECNRMIDEYAHELSHQGASIEQYLQMTGTKFEDLKNMMKPQATARIKTRYLLEEVANAENIKATAADIKKFIDEHAEKYGMEPEEFERAVGGKDSIEFEIRVEKALDIIKEA